MSATNLAEDALTARLKDRLNLESMKLWVEPFYDSTAKVPKDDEVIALGSRYAVELELPESQVIECLYGLQRHALEKKAEIETFKSTGMATLRVRFSGKISAEERTASTSLQKLQLNLSNSNGNDLKSSIADQLKVAANRLKLIFAGRVIDDSKMLEAQHLKNGSQVMALFLATDKETFQEAEDQVKELEQIKNSADYLASSNRHDDFALEITDQSGRPLELPEGERKALAIGLALHDKGRAAMKLQDFSKALIYLLEADTMYSHCQSALLERVDNYGVLNLDIAWCYLSLQSIAELPEAESRLQKSERALRKAYGEDMERVVALKGSTGWEAALFVRLHLLQAIASYHLGQIEKSRFLMTRAEEELNRLRVSDEKLAELIDMGYKENESRMALRATYGEIARAVDWIIRRREELREIKEQEKEKRDRRKLQKQLGNCDNGEPVNSRTFTQLKQMGYSPTLIKAALRRSNNDVNTAIQLLADDDFIAQARANITLPSATTDYGPSTSAAADAISTAVNAASAATASGQPNPDLVQTIADQLFETAIKSNTSLIDDNEMQKGIEAYESLKKDTCSESEYIDLNFSSETNYLEHYKTLIATIS